MKPQKVLHLHLEEAKKNPKLDKNYIITEKLDGWYTYIDYTIENGWDYICSSNGRIIPSMKWYRGVFQKLPNPKQSCRFIMEAVIPGLDFHTMNGLFNRSKGDCHVNEVVFNLHDYIDLETFYINRKENLALERYKFLQTLEIENSISNTIKLLPILGISSEKWYWKYLYEKTIDSGGEGIILKAENSLYQPEKRNSDLLKMKMECAKDLLVIDVLEGQGKYKETTGTLLCKNKTGTEIQVSGMSDSQRETWWHYPAGIIGKVIEVKAMCELENGSLREPRFKCIREDKTELEID